MVIYDNNGAVLLDIEVDDTSVRYKAIKGENSLTLKFSLAEHLEVPLGAYCVFKNETYSLMLPEDLTLHHRRDFEYTLVMYSEDYKARRYKFVNPVDRRLKFSLTAKPIEHLQMFVDNMNMRDRGWELGECPDHVEIVLSYNHTYCHDALVQLANELELDYWFNGKIVNLGKLELNKDNPLQLSYGGDGEGLKSDIKRTNYSDGLPIEVLYVQGSSTNIDPSKYRVNDKPVSELHLPISQTIGFDGTYFEDEDGYDATKARQYKTDENGFSVRRADRDVTNHSEDSLDCSEIEPTKTETIVSVIDVNTEKHFYDILFESTVDYSKYIIGGENATVVFQSGMLAGKEFDLATDENGNLVCKQDGGKWRVEIVPQDIDGITMPDKESGYLPAAGDTFKVFGIQLPDEYVSEAEMEMLRYAVKHMYLNEDVQYTIAGELDEIYSKRNWDSIKDRLSLGNYISFSDKSFQTEPLLIRIIGIKEFVNKPYSPQLEISNAALSGTLVGALNRIENQEVRTEDMFREAIGFTKRRWRDAKDTISMLQGAIDGFSEGITPITVETMSMLVGDERLQFVLTDSLTSDGHADLHYEYDAATRTFSVQSAFIKHITLGIDSISPVHTDDEYKRWYVIEKAEVLESEFGYYLYAKVSKSNTTGSFELSKTTIADDDEWYYLLVGIINSEYNGDRSFASMYGYTEVRPGQITTDSIRSSDGMTWLDLLKGILYLNNMAGVSGVKTEEKGDQSIAAWFGGLMKDIELDEDKENAAKSVIRHDGTGYFADGLFKWDKDTGVNLGNDAIRINYDGSVDFGGNIRIGSTGEETLDSLMTIIAKMSEMWSLDSDYNLVTDKQVIIKNNLVIHGDTASGGEGESNPVGISGITVNGVTYRDTDGDGLIDLGTIESGVAEITSAMVIEALGYTPYNASNPSGYITASALNGYATQSWVEGKNYLTSHQTIHALTIKNSAGTTQLTYTPNSGAGSLTLTKAMVGLGSVENTALSTWAGSAKITTLGTITSGTWNGSKIANSYLANSTMTIAGNSISLGGSLAVATLQSSLGLGSLAYKSSLVASDIPNLDWSKITSGKPTTVAGYGITDAITTGNIGSQSVNYATSAGNATTVGGITINMATVNNVNSGYWSGLGYGSTKKITIGSNYGGIAWRAENYCADLMFGCPLDTHGFISIGFSEPNVSFAGSNNTNASADSPNWYWKLTGTSGTTYDLNCAPTATKLATARTIWGQSFDGTGNVSGNLSLGHAILYWYSDPANFSLSANYTLSSSSPNINYKGFAGHVFYSGNATRLIINQSGNVTIGGSDLAGTSAKLYVSGTGRFTGATTINGALTVGAGATITGNSTIIGKLTIDLSTIDNALRVNGKSTLNGDVSIVDDLTVSGLSNLSGGALMGGTTRPSLDNTYSLGLDSYRWSTFYSVDGNFSGNVIVSGDVASGSDIRYKDFIAFQRIKVEDIAEAPLFTFRWNDREDKAVYLGTSAQYWDTVAPWLVKGEDFKTLDYSTLGVAIGISLANKSMNHEERIKILEKENKALKGEIRRMRHGLCN